MKSVCILWLCLTINSTYERRIANSTNDLESIFATWGDFQNRHIVSSDQGNAANWNTYFRLHMPNQYGNKSVNSFIVNSVDLIANNFPSGVPQYTGGSASNLYWSSTKQRIFVLTLSGPPGQPTPKYNVYDCGQKYYVAGLDMEARLPIHFHGHATTQGPMIDGLTAGCSIVTSRDFFCRVNETINGRHTHNCIVVIVSGTLFGLVIVAFLAAVSFKKYNGRRTTGNAAVNEYSSLIGNDVQNYGNQ